MIQIPPKKQDKNKKKMTENSAQCERKEKKEWRLNKINEKIKIKINNIIDN